MTETPKRIEHPGEPAMKSPKYRTVSRFSWNEVERGILRTMLIALYDERGNVEQVNKLAELPDVRLTDQARRSFAKQLAPKHMAVVASVLMDKWLPKAQARVVRELAVIVQAGLGPSERQEYIGSKIDALAFLRRRKHTRNFLANLRKAFLAEHKVSQKRPAKPSRKRNPPVANELVGSGRSRPYQPYPHQIDARQKLTKFLDEAQDHIPGGIIVLPTGAGKTETAVEWLLDRLAQEPNARVLWLAHQQELLVQAIDRFKQCATYRDIGFHRKARAIHAGGSAVTTLGEDAIDVAAVTIQSLARDLKGPKLKALRKFLRRPTYIVVDEVHHAGAPSYRKVLDEVALHAAVCFIGLSATPWPTSMLNRFHLRERFPANVCEVAPESLMAEGILANPWLHTVSTGQSIYLSEAELRFAHGGDLSPETLNRLDSVARNLRVVSAWQARGDEWGKSLVFATSIDHAEELTALLLEAGANVKALHSGSEERAQIFGWFKRSNDNPVIVSVGMLTEGVDIPDARTAFLARPTTSRILLRQMIGRVLRGKRAGGDDYAHVVYFQDEWGNFADILEPPEAVEFDLVELPDEREKRDKLAAIIVDDDGRPIPMPTRISVKRQFRQLDMRAGNNRGEIKPTAIDPGLFSTELIGFYDLQALMIAVFEHQLEGFSSLQEHALGGGNLTGKPYLSFFNDSRAPYPTQRSLSEFVNFCREFGEPPPFQDLRVTISPSKAADAIVAAGAITEERRAEIIESAWKDTIVRSAIPSLQRFEELVDAELRNRRSGGGRFGGEKGIPMPTKQSLEPLPRSERSLVPRIEGAVEVARSVLPPEHSARIDIPEVRWSPSVSRFTFGHWTIQLSGRNAGKQRICINRLLRAPAEEVPDGALEFLIFHELLHALLPGQGHDSEFRELEGRWPDCEVWDAWFNTLHERYDTRPERYA